MSCPVVLLLLLALSWPAPVSSQTNAVGIDFSTDLDRLEKQRAPPTFGDTPNRSIADTEQPTTGGGWDNMLDDLRQSSSDLAEERRLEKERKTQEEERLRQEKIEKATSDCEYYWKTPRQCDKQASRPKLLSHNEVTCRGPTIDGLDYCKGHMEICFSTSETQEDPDKYYLCMLRYSNWLKANNNITMTVGTTASVDARRKKDTERNQSNCRAKRTYCQEIKKEIAAGKIPTKDPPRLKRADQEKLVGVSTELNSVLKDTLYRMSDEFKDKQRREAEAIDKAKKDAVEQKLQEARIKGEKQRTENELSCTEAMSKGIYYCGCSEYFDKDVSTCTK